MKVNLRLKSLIVFLFFVVNSILILTTTTRVNAAINCASIELNPNPITREYNADGKLKEASYTITVNATAIDSSDLSSYRIVVNPSGTRVFSTYPVTFEASGAGYFARATDTIKDAGDTTTRIIYLETITSSTHIKCGGKDNELLTIQAQGAITQPTNGACPANISGTSDATGIECQRSISTGDWSSNGNLSNNSAYCPGTDGGDMSNYNVYCQKELYGQDGTTMCLPCKSKSELAALASSATKKQGETCTSSSECVINEGLSCRSDSSGTKKCLKDKGAIEHPGSACIVGGGECSTNTDNLVGALVCKGGTCQYPQECPNGLLSECTEKSDTGESAIACKNLGLGTLPATKYNCVYPSFTGSWVGKTSTDGTSGDTGSDTTDPSAATETGAEQCDATDEGCVSCINQGGIWTAIGCVDPTPLGIITGLIRIALGIVGGIALIQMIIVGIMYQTGDEAKIKDARSKLIATLSGVAVLVFSVLILRIIGINILDVVPVGSF